MKAIIRFWAPLCATWLLMAAEGPLLTAVIARLPNALENLAAYGLAVALAMLIESPVIMLLSTTVALARDKRAVHALWVFTLKVNACVTAGMVVVSIPCVFRLLVQDMLHVPSDVAGVLYWALVSMTLWPAAIGFRRFYQGVLIKHQRTKRVALGTAVRFLFMGASAASLVTATTLPGAVIGGMSLTIGVVAEAIATRWMALSILDSIHAMADSACGKPPSSAEIFRFYAPLATTSMMGFVVTPALAFFMNRAPEALASLAVLPVVDSFVFLFRSFGFSYQEVCIALMGENAKSAKDLRRVGLAIMIVTTVVFIAIAATPAMPWVYTNVYRLSVDLAAFAQLPTLLLCVLPTLAVLYSLERAALITARKNSAVTVSTMIEVGGVILTMAVFVVSTSLPGALCAALSMAVGRTAATVYLKAQTARLPRP
jgi:progressive ankylosis protein